MNKNIGLSVPNLSPDIVENLKECIETGWVSTGGRFIGEFENKIANYVGVDEAVSMQSGTAGLHMALKVLEIGQDDEVIVPTLTFIAAVNPVSYVGAAPIFMDCDDSLCIDPDKLEQFCEEECIVQRIENREQGSGDREKEQEEKREKRKENVIARSESDVAISNLSSRAQRSDLNSQTPDSGLRTDIIREQRTGNRDQGTENREQGRGENREERKEKREQGNLSSQVQRSDLNPQTPDSRLRTEITIEHRTGNRDQGTEDGRRGIEENREERKEKREERGNFGETKISSDNLKSSTLNHKSTIALINKKTGKRIRAIVVVHVFGNLANMEKIMSIAEKYNLKVIEDATEALGSYYIDGKYKGKHAGTIGDIGVYSFNANKIITTGGGGMIVSHNKKWLDKARYLGVQAKNDSLYFVHDEIGYNYRMLNIQAALGVEQIDKLEGFIETKIRNYNLYKELLIGDIGEKREERKEKREEGAESREKRTEKREQRLEIRDQEIEEKREKRRENVIAMSDNDVAISNTSSRAQRSDLNSQTPDSGLRTDITIDHKSDSLDLASSHESQTTNARSLELLPFKEGTRANHWFYSLLIDEKEYGVSRDELLMKLNEKGIQCRPVWRLIHKQKPYKDCQTYKIEKALHYEQKTLNIPCSTNLAEEDVRYVCNAIRSMV